MAFLEEQERGEKIIDQIKDSIKRHPHINRVIVEKEEFQYILKEWKRPCFSIAPSLGLEWERTSKIKIVGRPVVCRVKMGRTVFVQ